MYFRRGGHRKEDASESAAPLYDPKGTVIDRVRFARPALPKMGVRALPGSNGSSDRAN